MAPPCGRVGGRGLGRRGGLGRRLQCVAGGAAAPQPRALPRSSSSAPRRPALLPPAAREELNHRRTGSSGCGEQRRRQLGLPHSMREAAGAAAAAARPARPFPASRGPRRVQAARRRRGGRADSSRRRRARPGLEAEPGAGGSSRGGGGDRRLVPLRSARREGEGGGGMAVPAPPDAPLARPRLCGSALCGGAGGAARGPGRFAVPRRRRRGGRVVENERAVVTNNRADSRRGARCRGAGLHLGAPLASVKMEKSKAYRSGSVWGVVVPGCRSGDADGSDELLA